jgi:hypothetical protein
MNKSFNKKDSCKPLPAFYDQNEFVRDNEMAAPVDMEVEQVEDQHHLQN